METKRLPDGTPANTWVHRAFKSTFEPSDAHRALHAPRWLAPAGFLADTRDKRYDWVSFRRVGPTAA